MNESMAHELGITSMWIKAEHLKAFLSFMKMVNDCIGDTKTKNNASLVNIILKKMPLNNFYSQC